MSCSTVTTRREPKAARLNLRPIVQIHPAHVLNMFSALKRNKYLLTAIGASIAVVSIKYAYPKVYAESEKMANWIPPSRQELLQRLKGKSKTGENLSNPEFDLLIIGGGATGTGCALDAATRGLNVALVERDDFSSGVLN